MTKNPLQQLGDAYIESARRDQEARLKIWAGRPLTFQALVRAFGGQKEAEVMTKHQPPVMVLQQAALALFVEGPDAAASLAAARIRFQLKSIYDGDGWRGDLIG